jgi:hypothetical protein
MAKDTITLLQHTRGFVGLLKIYGGVEGMKCLQLIAGAIRVYAERTPPLSHALGTNLSCPATQSWHP